MKKTIIITMFITALCAATTASAQMLVHDLTNEITQLLTSADQVAVSSQNLEVALESIDKSSKMLDIAQKSVDKLRTVSKNIKLYSKVADILQYSVKTGNLYYKYSKFLIDGNFSEIAKPRHLANLYSLFTNSTEYVLEVNNLISDNLYEMSDAERITLINELHDKSSRNYSTMNVYVRRLLQDNYRKNAMDNDYNLLRQMTF